MAVVMMEEVKPRKKKMGQVKLVNSGNAAALMLPPAVDSTRVNPTLTKDIKLGSLRHFGGATASTTEEEMRRSRKFPADSDGKTPSQQGSKKGRSEKLASMQPSNFDEWKFVSALREQQQPQVELVIPEETNGLLRKWVHDAAVPTTSTAPSRLSVLPPVSNLKR